MRKPPACHARTYLATRSASSAGDPSAALPSGTPPSTVVPARCGALLTDGAAASGSLRSLLIKISDRLGQFDGEQGLDAGVQVEGFTSPAGPDGLRVGMLEAVHHS